MDLGSSDGNGPAASCRQRNHRLIPWLSWLREILNKRSSKTHAAHCA